MTRASNFTTRFEWELGFADGGRQYELRGGGNQRRGVC
jgi:hypothetical protein